MLTLDSKLYKYPIPIPLQFALRKLQLLSGNGLIGPNLFNLQQRYFNRRTMLCRTHVGHACQIRCFRHNTSILRVLLEFSKVSAYRVVASVSVCPCSFDPSLNIALCMFIRVFAGYHVLCRRLMTTPPPHPKKNPKTPSRPKEKDYFLYMHITR